MFDQTLRFFQNALAIKGVRRALWTFLVLTVFFVGFEAQTNYFEISAVSRRLELVEKAGQAPLTSEQATRIEKLKSSVIGDLETIQAKRVNPSGQFFSMAWRFVKGAWVTFPLFLIIGKLLLWILKQSKTDDSQVQGMYVMFGWLGFSAVTWIATMLGVNSVLWNSSDSFWIAWLVFPVCSAMALVVVIVWVMLLRTLLPQEQKQQSVTAATPPSSEAAE